MQKDFLHRFIFDNTPIRGNTVHLDASYQQALEHHDYPRQLRTLMGELMAASVLLTATLKLDGELIIQIQGHGALQLMVVECSSTFGMRATAKWKENLPKDFASMMMGGHCIITLDQKEGNPYQGIVPIEGNSIAQMLENYMLRSQQIDTRIWLTCDGEHAAGMLIQKLPTQTDQIALEAQASEIALETWQRISYLAQTVTEAELLHLPTQTLLTRLFHEEDIRLFEASATQFTCSCSHESVINMLRLLGKDEINSIIEEQEMIEVNCDFCNKRYVFDRIDTVALIEPTSLAAQKKSLH